VTNSNATPASEPKPDFTLYCDEAGNTGDNYLDSDQPVFVMAGVVVRPETEPLLAARVATLEAEYRSTLQPRERKKEVKSSKVLRTEEGRRLVVNLVKGLGGFGVLPVVFVAEKRFCAAAKVVETLLDPEHNAAAEWLPTNDNVERPQTAEALAEYPLPVLQAFVSAYQQPSVEAIQAAAAALASEAELRGHARLAMSFRGARDSAATIAAAEIKDDGQPGGRGASIAINLPVFLSFLTAADTVIAEKSSSCLVVHDETTQFEPIFRRWFDTMKQVPLTVYNGVLRDGREMRFGYEGLQSFRFGSSRSEAGIRAADYLAGLVVAMGKAGVRGVVHSPELLRARALISPLLLAYAPNSIFATSRFMRDGFALDE
jgi:hypothetical protein